MLFIHSHIPSARTLACSAEPGLGIEETPQPSGSYSLLGGREEKQALTHPSKEQDDESSGVFWSTRQKEHGKKVPCGGLWGNLVDQQPLVAARIQCPVGG